MAGRNLVFADNEYYHVFNRGISRQPVYFGKNDYDRFVLTLSYYRFAHPPVRLSRFLQLARNIREDLLAGLQTKNEKQVEIIAYCLMPNHFHLLLKQERVKGITNYMSRLTNSYTRYINTKKARTGDLFVGVFKAVHIETDEQLFHVSRYIHLNPIVSFLIKQKDLGKYTWSSFGEYIHGDSTILDLKPVLSHFTSPLDYKKFVNDQAEYGKKLEQIKHLTLD